MPLFCGEGLNFGAFSKYFPPWSRNTFKLWTRVMRFDDPSDRLAKYSTDTFAAIRDF
jgi:hypothetical protein